MKDDGTLAPYLQRLRALPFVEQASLRRRATESSSTIWIKAGSAEQSFQAIALRSQLGRNEAELWATRAQAARQSARMLLLTPYVSGPLGARLRAAGVYYLDGCGNTFLEITGEHGPQHVALIEGNVPARSSISERAWRAQSYQVLFTLLAKPSLLTATVRHVASEAEVSTTPVLQVREKLLQLGFVGENKAGLVWTPRGLARAREFWLPGYQSTLRPNLLIQRYRPRKNLTIADLEAEITAGLEKRFSWRWGGAAAAFRLDQYYRGEQTVVHIHAKTVDKAELTSALRMLPDPHGAVVLLRSPGRHGFALGQAELKLPPLPPEEARDAHVVTTQPFTVHPLLVWAELLEEGNERASEAALELATHFLEGDPHAQ